MRAWSLPLWVGGATVLVAGAFSWVPSFWWDEAATISAADRPVSALLELHGLRDAVHAFHNLLLHYWFQIVGVGEFTARFPGVLALGAGAAAVTATGQLAAGRRVGVAAGVVFALSPRVLWAATEARSYAFAMALTALLSLVLLMALRRRATRWWVLYALLVPVAGTMFLYSLTVVVAHAVTVLLVARRSFGVFVATAAAGVGLATPFVLLAYSQAGQVSWIPPLDETLLRTLAVDQWFPQAPWTAVLCAVLLVAATVVAVRRGIPAGEWRVLGFAVPGVVVPVGMLLTYSLFDNMYLERYLAFTVPALALLVGWAAARVATRWWSALALFVALAVSVAPAYVQQRQPFGKAGGTDYSAAADLLVDKSRPGECVAFEPTVSWTPTSPRAVMDARPDAVEGLDDVGLGRDAVERTNLWSSDAPPDVLAERAAARCDVLWVIADGDRDTGFTVWHPNDVLWKFEPYRFADTDTFRELSAAGFEVVDRERIHHLQLIRLEPQTQ